MGVAWCLEKINHYGVDQFYRDDLWFFLESSRQAGMRELVVEKFTPRPMLAVDLSPVEVIGIIKEWSRQKAWYNIVWQSPSEAKFYFTNARLKERRLYQPNVPHGLDALRHVLYRRQDFGVSKKTEGAVSSSVSGPRAH